jgi:hypothetical protein
MNLGQVHRRPVQANQLGISMPELPSVADIGTQLKEPIMKATRTIFQGGLIVLAVVVAVKLTPMFVKTGGKLGKQGINAAKSGYKQGRK